MSFSKFLNEGLIKTPKPLQDAAQNFFAETVLSYLTYYGLKLTQDKDEREYVILNLKRIANSLKVPLKLKTPKSIYQHESKIFPVGNFAEAYVKSYNKLHGPDSLKNIKDLKVKINLAFTKHKQVGSSGGVYLEKKTPEIVVSIYGLELTHDEVFDPNNMLKFNSAAVLQKIKEGFATIEHELTHLVQFKVLQFLHSDQIKSHEGTYEIGTDSEVKYYNSNIEFSPVLKTELRDFRSFVEKMKIESSSKKTKDFFNKWVQTSPFFIVLKQYNDSNWKKAIKIMWLEYEKKYL